MKTQCALSEKQSEMQVRLEQREILGGLMLLCVEHLMEDRKASWKEEMIAFQLDQAALALLAAPQGTTSHELIKALIADRRAWQALYDDWGTLLQQDANLQYFVDCLGTPPTATTEAALRDLLKTECKLTIGCATAVARVARLYGTLSL